MSHRYQVTIAGRGFSTMPDADDASIVGFFAIRRARADTPEEAYWTAVRALEREWKFQWLIESTREHIGDTPPYKLELEEIGYLSWWRWHFTRPDTNFAFYETEDDVPAKA
jgi:hypothetical protein